MTECIGAQITIGGNLSRAIVPGLCTAIAAQPASLEWSESPFVPTSTEELLAARQTIDGELVLRLYAPQARYGKFAALEAFLVKRRITFDRQSEGYFEHAPELVAYRPECDHALFSTNGGEVVIPAAPFWELSRTLDHLRRGHKRNARKVARQVDELLTQLRDSIPLRPVPLTSFEIGVSIGLRSAA